MSRSRCLGSVGSHTQGVQGGYMVQSLASVVGLSLIDWNIMGTLSNRSFASILNSLGFRTV